jgi:hypothetical protein
MGDVPQTAPARDLTAEEADERAQAMFDLDQSIKAGFRAGREAMWNVARDLAKFDEESGWTALGYDKLGDWLADPDVSLGRRTYYRMVSVWRELEQRRVSVAELAELDTSKVDIVLGAVKAGRADIDDALADAKTLGARDLREKYYDRPDPKDSATAPASANDGTNGVGGDWTPPPVNDGHDTPQWASDDAERPIDFDGDDDSPALDLEEPDHNSDDDPSGHVPEDIEGTATVLPPAETTFDVDEPVNATGPSASQVMDTLHDAIADENPDEMLEACRAALKFLGAVWPNA